MKKFISFCLLALVAVLSFGCEETKEFSYYIQSASTGMGYSGIESEDGVKSPVKEAYDAIVDKLIGLEKQYTTEWPAKVVNDDYSAADADAKARFAEVKSAYAKVESECNEILKSIEGNDDATFDISGRFYLQRFDTKIDQFTYSFQHGK